MKKMTFSDILESKPKRYEITNDQRFLFELENGEKVELACDYCGQTLWQIGYLKENKRLAFRIICLNCTKGFYYLWMEPRKSATT